MRYAAGSEKAARGLQIGMVVDVEPVPGDIEDTDLLSNGDKAVEQVAQAGLGEFVIAPHRLDFGSNDGGARIGNPGEADPFAVYRVFLNIRADMRSNYGAVLEITRLKRRGTGHQIA